MLKVATAITIPQAVLQAALTLHKQKDTGLTLSLSSTAQVDTTEKSPLWCFEDDLIKFSDLEARNYCTALAVFEQLMPLSDTDALFDAAHELWRNEIGHSDSASGRLLGLAAQNVNVLMESARAIRNRQHQAFNVFNVLHLIEVALPHLTRISPEAVMAIVDAQHESTKRDMAVGQLFNAIERRLRSESQLAWDIYRLTREKMSEPMQNLYSTALQSLMWTDQQRLALERAREDADVIDPLIAGTALWVLARSIQAHELEDAELDRCVAVLTKKATTASIEIQRAAIRAVAHASLKDQRLMSELVRLAAQHDDYILATVADFLFMNQRDLDASSPHFQTLIEALIGLAPSQQNAINNFDWVLHQLYASPQHRPLVLGLLTQWLIQHGDVSLNDKALVELFDQTIIQIVNDEPAFQTVITRWLVAPEKQLARAVGGLISYLHIREAKSPKFSAEVLDTFTSQDFRLLARRLLGYVISEEPLLTLTFSLLETNNAFKRSFVWVHALLTQEVGRDFPHATIEALKARQEIANAPEREFLVQISEILVRRSTDKDGLPRLQELRPPMRLRRAIALNRAREMDQAMEIADEKSIVRLISTVIPMKAGRGWFSVTGNQVGPTHQLQSFSHSVSLPRRAVTDPVGYAIAGLHYRIAKRDDE